ncbi:MAG: hypothetical protein K2O89_07775 [Clostridia bacterium]|nr:hypothetical protein [Clostridia bacterium]
METEIAKTKKTMLAAYIIIIVCGAIFCLFGIFALIADEILFGAVALVVGLVCVGTGIVWTVYITKKPKVYITFKEGKFYFWNGLICSPSEVDYCSSRSAGIDGAIANYGKLIISVNHTEYKLPFVEGVGNVVSNITALKAQYIAIEEMQKHIAEKKSEEDPVQEDEKG